LEKFYGQGEESHKGSLTPLKIFNLKIDPRFRGGIHPDARMKHKRERFYEAKEKRGLLKIEVSKEEHVNQEYDRAIQVLSSLSLSIEI
jgi:hypothetical protein